MIASEMEAVKSGDSSLADDVIHHRNGGEESALDANAFSKSTTNSTTDTMMDTMTDTMTDTMEDTSGNSSSSAYLPVEDVDYHPMNHHLDELPAGFSQALERHMHVTDGAAFITNCGIPQDIVDYLGKDPAKIETLGAWMKSHKDYKDFRASTDLKEMEAAWTASGGKSCHPADDHDWDAASAPAGRRARPARGGRQGARGRRGGARARRGRRREERSAAPP